MIVAQAFGNVLNTDCSFIAHGCNCVGVMNKGVAKQIKETYPKAYVDYVKGLEKGAKLGDVIVSNVGTLIEPRIIFHCLTQLNYSSNPKVKNVDYEAIRSCMYKINKFFVNDPLWSVAMPQIGAGLGGGNWKKIVSIIEKESTHFFPRVYILDKDI